MTYMSLFSDFMLHFEDNLMCDYHSSYVIYTKTLAINGWKGFAYSFGLLQTKIVFFIYFLFFYLFIYFFESVKFFILPVCIL